MIRRALLELKDRLIYAVVASLAVGLAFGQVAPPGAEGVLRAAVVPVLFLMVYPMMVNIDLREVVEVREHARPVALTLLVNFAVLPVLAFGLAAVFLGGRPGAALGLYFVALIPTSGMTAAWTGLAGGDLETALVAMAVNLLVAVVVLPTYLGALVPATVDFDPSALYRQLALVVVAPMAAGAATRWAIRRRHGAEGYERLRPVFGGLSSVGVVLIVFVAMAMRSDRVLADPVSSAGVVVPLVAFYAAVLGTGVVVGRVALDPGRAVALVYATSMRNLSIALAVIVATPAVPAAAVLPVALAYVVQPPLGALYVHYRRDVVEEGLSVRGALGGLVRG